VIATTVARPTENAAIGRIPKPPRLNPDLVRADLDAARERLDRFGEYLLGGRLARALGKTAE
jgi:hypothetical protein